MIQFSELRLKKPFGEELLEKEVIAEEELATALNLQKQSGEKIGKLLVDIGALSEVDMVAHLSEYLNVPYVTSEDFPQVPVVENTFSAKFMRECKFFPISVEGSEKLTLAMAEPQDYSTLDSIRIYTGYEELQVFLAPESAILDLIEKFYGNQASTLGRIVEDIDEESDALGENIEDIEHLKDLASEAPVIRLVNLVMSRAIESRASDIHIEPFERDLKVRYRIDGILYDVESPPKRLKAAIISRIKIMARLNIAERRIPQDGRIKMKVLGKDIDLRVSTLPTMYGESVVMRILDKSNTQIYDLERLGFSSRMYEQFENLIVRPYGIMLVTGPTGSGKTTTLYGGLTKINQPDKKIITIEDPVEYQINGINQIHVNPQIGLTFAAGLRSIVRQDPDVIMVGEMRDLETVEIGIRAALTGHLVFSTLHTNDAPSAIARMVDMGAEDYLLASSILGILAQRLVRVICPECKEEQQLEKSFLEEIGFPFSEDTRLYQGRGCKECGKTGYRGRLGIFELMLMDEDIRRLTITNADASQLRKTAIQNGMSTLRKDGFEKIKGGITTISEVLRVTQDI
ncbi:type II secretion system ATPase GspE [Acidobacteria bacterium AH-259-L09]|nr:type II secretion system ATPase GspE [Acidobacteria bacterium AH-259-L09]